MDDRNRNLDVTAPLMEEHEILRDFISVLRSGVKTDASGWLQTHGEQVANFIEGFADDFHHAHEEEGLFALMREPGTLGSFNALPKILVDHDNGRTFTLAIRNSLDEKNWSSMASYLEGWASHMEQHLSIEEKLLFPLAESVLNDEQKQRLQSLSDSKRGQALWQECRDLLDAVKQT